MFAIEVEQEIDSNLDVCIYDWNLFESRYRDDSDFAEIEGGREARGEAGKQEPPRQQICDNA